MAKKRTLNDADQEIAALRAQLAQAGAGAADAPEVKLFPCAMYRKAKVTAQTPQGYEARRVNVKDAKGELDEAACAAQVAQMEKAGWLHSPESFAI